MINAATPRAQAGNTHVRMSKRPLRTASTRQRHRFEGNGWKLAVLTMEERDRRGEEHESAEHRV